MHLRRRIDRLLELSERELSRPSEAPELEDALQRGLSAIHVGELWVSFVGDQFEVAAGSDPARAQALSDERRRARASLEAVRRRVLRLASRARMLGIGAPQS